MRVKLNDLLIFSKQFHTLLKAGIPLFRSLETVTAQTQSPDLKIILGKIKAEIMEGQSLSTALRKFPEIFPEYYISLVSIGESKGTLDDSFLRVASYLEKKRELTNKIINTIIYPAILITTGVMVVILMVSFVLPRFVSIFVQNDLQLPFFTRMLMGLSTFLVNNYILLIVLIGAAVIFTLAQYRTPQGKIRIDRFLISIPVIGRIFYNIAITRFAWSLGILYGSGVPLIASIEMARDAMGNAWLSSYVDKAVASVRDGKGVAAPLDESGLFPPILVEMLNTGEETGTLDKLAIEAADFLDKETEYSTKRMMALIEPLALLIIGLLVLVIALSFFIPILKLAANIRQTGV